MGAVFVPDVPSIGIANHAPVLMGDDAGEGDVVLVHEARSEAGGAVHGGLSGARGILAHFNADRVAVPRAFVVGVLTLFKVREALVNGSAIHGVVPGKIAERILGALECASLKHAGVGLGGAVSAEILSGMNGDVAWFHSSHAPTSNLTLPDERAGDLGA